MTDECRFVAYVEPDPRPHYSVDGIRFRRGANRVSMEAQCEGETLWLTISFEDSDDGTYAFAFLGPLLDYFWDWYAKNGDSGIRPQDAAQYPALVSAMQQRQVSGQLNGLAYTVTVVPPGPACTATAVAVRTEGHVSRGFTAEYVVAAGIVSKAALDILADLVRLQRDIETIDNLLRPSF